MNNPKFVYLEFLENRFKRIFMMFYSEIQAQPGLRTRAPRTVAFGRATLQGGNIFFRCFKTDVHSTLFLLSIRLI